MNIDLLLYIVLFSQIMFLSYYYPRRMLIRIHTIFENYPPNEFPKLYPESIEKYKKSAKRYQVMNHLIYRFRTWIDPVVLCYTENGRVGSSHYILVFHDSIPSQHWA